MSSTFTLSRDAGVFYLPLDFALEHGGCLPDAQVAYELFGAEDGPLVVVLGGISAGREVRSWWGDLVGEGKAIDTTSCRVLGIDYLGGAGASTGPSTWLGRDSFPAVSTLDQARAISLLLTHLGVDRLRRFVGSSFGGMVGLAFAAEFPERLEGLVAIGAAHEPHPMASAWRSLQRSIIEFGVLAGDPASGVALARGLAMTTYRSHEEFGGRFASTPIGLNGRLRLPVDDYLDARGRDFAERFSSETYLALSQAIDLHRVEPEAIRVPTTLVGISSDQIVPLCQVEELAARLGDVAQLIELPSRYGHDGFLKEVDALSVILGRALRLDSLEDVS